MNIPQKDLFHFFAILYEINVSMSAIPFPVNHHRRVTLPPLNSHFTATKPEVYYR